MSQWRLLYLHSMVLRKQRLVSMRESSEGSSRGACNHNDPRMNSIQAFQESTGAGGSLLQHLCQICARNEWSSERGARTFGSEANGRSPPGTNSSLSEAFSGSTEKPQPYHPVPEDRDCSSRRLSTPLYLPATPLFGTLPLIYHCMSCAMAYQAPRGLRSYESIELGTVTLLAAKRSQPCFALPPRTLSVSHHSCLETSCDSGCHEDHNCKAETSVALIAREIRTWVVVGKL